MTRLRYFLPSWTRTGLAPSSSRSLGGEAPNSLERRNHARRIRKFHDLLRAEVGLQSFTPATRSELTFRIIAYMSQGTTLPAGTVIITGTPSGIGNGRSPRVWLKDGDVVRCSISHGIGSLQNIVEYMK
jgi:hypothetical protein